MARTTHRWLTLLAVLVWHSHALAQSAAEPEIHEHPVLEPKVERRDVMLPRIDTEDFEMGIFVGYYSAEDFGAEPVYGLTVGYHVIEDIFFEAALGQTTVSDATYRGIGLNVFPEEEENLTYYNLSVGYNLFPGELFFGRNKSLTTDLYFIAGAGNTYLADDTRYTMNYGFGLRLLATDWVALRFDLRDHVFDSDLFGTNKTLHNLEWRTGLTVFF